MIIVTGGAGFIGSNIVKALNERGHKDIIVVDDLTDGAKFVNLVDCDIADYLDAVEFRSLIVNDKLKPLPEAILHNSGCSSTIERNGKYMLDVNFTMSKELLNFCQKHKIPMIYASSAAVYGANRVFSEDQNAEMPLNVYGYSKLLFDRYVAHHHSSPNVQIVGLRYFDVYGPREQHKGKMASLAFQLHQQIQKRGRIQLFGEYDGYAAGRQSRDFIHVDDVVKANLWFLDHPELSGIYNVGTGRTETFLDVAAAVVDYYGTKDQIHFVPFPESLKGSYQSYTCADTSKLREAGFTHKFKPVSEGVREYMDWLNRSGCSKEVID